MSAEGDEVSSESKLIPRPPIDIAKFDSLQPDRFDEIFLYPRASDLPPQDYRYKLTVLDRAVTSTTTGMIIVYATAVFLIPAGRESEYIFRTKQGLRSIAESAKCARLLAVSFSRHHVFESQDVVQNELMHVVQLLSRQGTFLSKQPAVRTDIPFMTVQGIGERNMVTQGSSALSGPYVVEQVNVEGQMVRRLYFLNNPLVIQSEVLLLKAISNKNACTVVQKSVVAFDYHKEIVAGILALLATRPQCGLMIGLGGGGLFNFMQYVLPDLQLTALELDSVIAAVAQEYFGVETSPTFTIQIGNGLQVSSQGEEGGAFQPKSLSFIIIDVDAKDTTVGLSCPPQSFVEEPYLTELSQLLEVGGILAVNVSARDPQMLHTVCTKIKTVFGTVVLSHKNAEGYEALNVVAFARNDDDDDDDNELEISASQCTERLERAVPDDDVVRADLQTVAEKLCVWDAAAISQGVKTKKKSKKSNTRKGGKKR